MDNFSSFWAYFGHAFGCSCWGGYAPPDPPALDFIFVVLGYVFSQLCQENPRTCRGQSRESKNLPRTKPRTKSVRTPSRKLKSPSFVLLNSFPYRKPPYSKNVGRRYSPQGGFNPPPNRGRRVRSGSPVLPILPPSLLPDSSSQRFLFPSPKSSPSRLGPTPSSAAICGAGASWRLLGRKSRVPRGLQKLIKF